VAGSEDLRSAPDVVDGDHVGRDVPANASAPAPGDDAERDATDDERVGGTEGTECERDRKALRGARRGGTYHACTKISAERRAYVSRPRPGPSKSARCPTYNRIRARLVLLRGMGVPYAEATRASRQAERFREKLVKLGVDPAQHHELIVSRRTKRG